MVILRDEEINPKLLFLPNCVRGGGKWIGAYNKLLNAMAIWGKEGCRGLIVLAVCIEIFDNKLKTDNVTVMAKDVIKSEKKTGGKEEAIDIMKYIHNHFLGNIVLIFS